MNYYRRYSGDYLRDTARLSMIEHGAYSLMLDYYYSEESPLPLERDEIYTMVRAMTPADRKAVDKVLNKYFNPQNDGYHNSRADHEIEVSKKARANGKEGGRPKTGLITGSETGSQTEMETGTITGEGAGSGHPPTTNHQPPSPSPQPPASNHQPKAKTTRAKRDAIKPDSVSEKVWCDFLEIRKAKRAPLSDTALEGIEREARKAGMTLQAALETACARGWQGFEAEWVRGSGGNAAAFDEAERLIFGDKEKDITHDSERI